MAHPNDVSMVRLVPISVLGWTKVPSLDGALCVWLHPRHSVRPPQDTTSNDDVCRSALHNAVPSAWMQRRHTSRLSWNADISATPAASPPPATRAPTMWPLFQVPAPAVPAWLFLLGAYDQSHTDSISSTVWQHPTPPVIDATRLPGYGLPATREWVAQAVARGVLELVTKVEAAQAERDASVGALWFRSARQVPSVEPVV